MTANARMKKRELNIYLIFGLMIITPVAIYWRSDLFFMWDDWSELDLLANKSFLHYLIVPDGEIYFPIYHLINYAWIVIIGDKYSLLVLINCVGVGVSAFLLYQFLKIHWSGSLPLAMSLFYAGSAVNLSISWISFYLCYILSLIFFLLALLLTHKLIQSFKYTTLLWIFLFAFLSIHSHNITILALLCLPIYFNFFN